MRASRTVSAAEAGLGIIPQGVAKIPSRRIQSGEGLRKKRPMISTIPTTNELLKKYNVPGPRYTSYPTVPYWEKNPTKEEWLNAINGALQEARSNNTGAALYVHIPFCESLCTYCGCNTRITRNRAVGNPYVDTVLKEWDLYLSALGSTKALISEINICGGTPTFLSSGELGRLVEGSISKF